MDGDVAGLADALVVVGGDGLHVGDGGEGVWPAGFDFVEDVVPGASALEVEDLLEGELDAAQGECVLDGFSPDGFGVDEGAVEVKEVGAGHEVIFGGQSGCEGTSGRIKVRRGRGLWPPRFARRNLGGGHKISVRMVYAIGKSGLAV